LPTEFSVRIPKLCRFDQLDFGLRLVTQKDHPGAVFWCSIH
jgi:hypothetical protein